MNIDETSNPGAGHGLGLAFDAANVSHTLREQSGAWFNAQVAFAGAAQKMMSAWVECRQEDAQATLKAFQLISTCKDGVGVASACNDWFLGSIGRIKDELGDMRDEALRMSAIGQHSMKALSPNEADGMPISDLAVTNSKTATRHALEDQPSKSHLDVRKQAASD